MARRIPLISTIVVALALIVMIALGVWQLQRAAWKENLLARLEANRGLPEIAYPASISDADLNALLFRQAAGTCPAPTSIRATAGRDMTGTSGWSYIAACGPGATAPAMTVDIGWSPAFGVPVRWAGGDVAGVIVPDSQSRLRLVAGNAAPGLRPSQPPGPETIPNNHRFYAAQWFFFAVAAGLIYWLALGTRRKTSP